MEQSIKKRIDGFEKENSMRIQAISLLSFVCILFHTYSFGQSPVKRAYEISPIGKPQTLVLLEYENEEYDAYIFTELRRMNEDQTSTVADKYKFVNLDIQALMNELKKVGIESLESCRRNEKCRVGYLHSDAVYFSIQTDKVRAFSYEEIYPIKGLNKHVETNAIRRKAQSLVTIAYNYIDFSKEFENLMERLPRGVYEWSVKGGAYIARRKNKM